jgi:mono/diheme cytochrome c family protein
MRYFLLIFGLAVVLVIAIAGKRGDMTRRTPIEVFPDMDRQLKLRPMEPNGFFANARSSQEHPIGTIARSTPLTNGASQAVFPYEDNPLNTGQKPGTTNFVELNPMTINAEVMKRGQQRYTINCSPCHGQLADGNGVTKKYGMAVVANLHDKRIVEMPDGELFHVITQGRNLMQGYAAQVDVQDRWAIVAYLRALQLARLGSVDDVPEAYRNALPK